MGRPWTIGVRASSHFSADGSLFRYASPVGRPALSWAQHIGGRGTTESVASGRGRTRGVTDRRSETSARSTAGFSAHLISAARRQWLILALDWRISDGGIAWAQDVLRRHPTLPAIVATHDLAVAEDSGEAFLSGNAQRLWDRLIKDNDQIFLTLNGHYWPPGRTVLHNSAGHDVHVRITNYQDRYYGGAAMIRLYHFYLARDRIDVETFSPWFLARDPQKRTELEAETIELTGDVDRFSLDLDFTQRFAGFAPAALPAQFRTAGHFGDRRPVTNRRAGAASAAAAPRPRSAGPRSSRTSCPGRRSPDGRRPGRRPRRAYPG
jgi:hypothetical protein